ncbi:MAG: hybrid sensor histidine kinase/response regulator [Desulfamplus sp.]|nr:hybrid sensor histidine kinase/response regulator [Desulfamplus sp.]
MAFDRSKFITRFVEDARDHVKSMNLGLIELEKNPRDEGMLNNVFRSAHSIKGASRMMKFIGISDFAHSLEDLFDALRNSRISWSPSLKNLLYEGVDALSSMLSAVSESGSPEPEPPEELMERLTKAVSGELSGSIPGNESGSMSGNKSGSMSENESGLMSGKVSGDVSGAMSEDAPDSIPPEHTDGIEGDRVVPVEESPGERVAPVEESRGERVVPVEEPRGERVFLAEESPVPSPPVSPAGKFNGREESIRVNVSRLDNVINLMGELNTLHRKFALGVQRMASVNISDTFQRTASVNVPGASPEKGYVNVSGVLPGMASVNIPGASPEKGYVNGSGAGPLDSMECMDVAAGEELWTKLHEIKTLNNDIMSFLSSCHPLMTELQDRALELRMQPLSTIFDGLYQRVRELSKEAGKSIDLTISGGGTEMDRKMIEKLKDPIIHMLRNSIDHGIESREERMAAGKPEQGSISLNAGYEGSMVLITLRDDGRGINDRAIAEKALAKGLITRDELSGLSRGQRLDLMFLPGITTSGMITSISGRGVGMDVVKGNLEGALNGSIQIDTERHRGTAFHIRLPATISLIHIFIIKVFHKNFAVPASHIRKIARIPKSDIIILKAGRALRLGDSLVPLRYLSRILDIPDKSMKETEELLVIITGTRDEPMAFVIDDMTGEERMIVKSLPPHMERFKMVSGVIITGDNELINVLNMPRVIEMADKDTHLKKRVQGHPSHDLSREMTRDAKRESVPMHFLVVDDSVSTREIEKNILESYGYQVTLAVDGADALEKCGKFQYDLVITDVDMPRMDGFTLTQNLREMHDYSTTPIILVTSRERREDMIQGLDSGADAYIIKGDFDKNSLMETIESLTA